MMTIIPAVPAAVQEVQLTPTVTPVRADIRHTPARQVIAYSARQAKPAPAVRLPELVTHVYLLRLTRTAIPARADISPVPAVPDIFNQERHLKNVLAAQLQGLVINVKANAPGIHAQQDVTPTLTAAPAESVMNGTPAAAVLTVKTEQCAPAEAATPPVPAAVIMVITAARDTGATRLQNFIAKIPGFEAGDFAIIQLFFNHRFDMFF